MPDPAILYCVGATKAGTSWLYRHLHDHPSCRLPAVKEAHYWDTFHADARDRQVAAFDQRLTELHALLAEADAAGRGWQVRNVTRRIADLTGLLDVLQGDRAGDAAYLAWLTRNAEQGQVVADMTPAYATLTEDRLARMRDLTPLTKFVYLIRDPIDRLWSHVRMQAQRQRQDHEAYEKKANNILWRVVNAGKETHLPARGDYAATITRLQKVVPAGRLLIVFTETLSSAAGLQRLSAFLGIPEAPAATADPVHAGDAARMRDDLRPKVAEFLKDQYDFVARQMGPLPQRWQDNLQGAMA